MLYNSNVLFSLLRKSSKSKCWAFLIKNVWSFRFQTRIREIETHPTGQYTDILCFMEWKKNKGSMVLELIIGKARGCVTSIDC